MAKKELDNNTETIILDAARKIFTQKGFAAARMEDIANEAGINRALLNYYFRSKDKIFEIVFEEKFKLMFGGITGILLSDLPLFEKIRQFIDFEITMLSKNMDMPIFVLSEITRDAQAMIKRMIPTGQKPSDLAIKIRQQARELASAGVIKNIDGAEIFINMSSLCIFQFVASPMFKQLLELDDQQYLEFLDRRKKEIYEFVIDGIKIKS